MKKLANVKFWSFLVAGVACALFGVWVLTSGVMSERVAAMLIIAAVVQLTIFYAILFFWKRKKD